MSEARRKPAVVAALTAPSFKGEPVTDFGDDFYEAEVEGINEAQPVGPPAHTTFEPSLVYFVVHDNLKIHIYFSSLIKYSFEQIVTCVS